jgi:predicted phosphohydrolase
LSKPACGGSFLTGEPPFFFGSSTMRFIGVAALIISCTLKLAAAHADSGKTIDGQFHPFKFAVLSDLHLSEHQAPERLDRAMQMIANRHDIAFVLVLGDIVWSRNPDDLKTVLAKAGVPVHLVFGNNDWKWVENGSYEKAFGPRDYAFAYAGCTFIQMWDCLPRNHISNHRGELTESQWAWLEEQLRTAQQKGSVHTFISMHVPPDSPGGFNNLFFMFTQTQDRLYGLMDKYGVSAGLFGHLHQSLEWVHYQTQMYVSPSCCWNFISRTRKVNSSFMRIMTVDKDKISDQLIPVRLPGETFTWNTLADFYDPAKAPK